VFRRLSPYEVLVSIFKYVDDPTFVRLQSDLFSCLLVNHLWKALVYPLMYRSLHFDLNWYDSDNLVPNNNERIREVMFRPLDHFFELPSYSIRPPQERRLKSG